MNRRTPIDLEQPCQLWTGNLHDAGYGRIMIDGKTLFVHRVSYQLHVGPIHRGWEVDHLCHNAAFDAGLCTAGPCEHRRCFNPAHLDPFGGTGTTAMVAKALGRHGITVDMSADYCRLATWRTNDRDQLAKVLGIPKADRQPDTQLNLFGDPA